MDQVALAIPCGAVDGCPTLSSQRLQVLFNSLSKVLFNFRSRYLFAIGLPVIFSLGRGIAADSHCNTKQYYSDIDDVKDLDH